MASSRAADFPTGGQILGRRGIATRTHGVPTQDAGGGLRSKPSKCLARPRDAVIITEFAHQTNQASLIERMAEW